MAEARWNDTTRTPEIDWSMSAALGNVERGGQEIAEVTSLAQAVSAWRQLGPDVRESAILKTEHPIQFDGAAITSFAGATLAALADRAQPAAIGENNGGGFPDQESLPDGNVPPAG